MIEAKRRFPMRLSFAVLATFGGIFFPPSVSQAEPIRHSHIDLQVKCAEKAPNLGRFAYEYEIGGAARFALGVVRDGQLPPDISVSINVEDHSLPLKTGSSIVFLVEGWTITSNIHVRPFPKRLPIPDFLYEKEDTKFIDFLYDPINPEMPPIAFELTGETDDCQKGTPKFELKVWRGPHLVLALSTLRDPPSSTGPDGSSYERMNEALATYIKYHYKKSLDDLFTLPPKAINSEFREGYSNIYNKEDVLDAIDVRGVIDITKVGKFCANPDGSLLIFKSSGSPVFTFTIDRSDDLILFRPNIYVDIDDIWRSNSLEGQSMIRRQLELFSKYTGKYFYRGRLLEFGDESSLAYLKEGQKRILTRLECEK